MAAPRKLSQTDATEPFGSVVLQGLRPAAQNNLHVRFRVGRTPTVARSACPIRDWQTEDLVFVFSLLPFV